MSELETLARPRDLIGELEARLCQAGIASARAEAEWLVADTLGVRRTDLYLWDEPMSPAQVDVLQERVSRRLSGEPLQYVLGTVEFLGHRLAVNPLVLIPRPETEALAVEAIAALRALVASSREPVRVLDVGTGSGCLAISLAHAVEACTITALELSWNTLQTARAMARQPLPVPTSSTRTGSLPDATSTRSAAS